MLFVAPWEVEDAKTNSAGDVSVVAGHAGDLVAFNASALHEAANAGNTPTAALYQGFLPLAAMPRFCSAPTEASRDGARKHDGTWEVLRPSGDPEGSLSKRLSRVRQQL